MALFDSLKGVTSLLGGGSKSSGGGSAPAASSSYTPGQGARVIYKPNPSNPGKGPVVLVPSGTTDTPTITTADGQVITGRFINEVEGARQFEFPRSIITQGNLNLNVGGSSAPIERGSISYEGPPDLSQFNARAKGSIGVPTGINPGGQFGYSQLGYGVAPADLNALFPEATKTQLAKFKFTDPSEFAASYSKGVTDQFRSNFDLSQDLALEGLDTELKGLEAFTPAAAALKRSTIAADNTFNQGERTRQVDSTIPGARAALTEQLADARVFASGGVPDAITDRALTLTNRSRAADQAVAGGFGASSSVARRSSDLMDAESRIKLAQYGNQLTGQNLEAQAALFLAPTQYSTAGASINVNPLISGSQLAASQQGQLNNLNTISAGNALSSTTGQQMFKTQQRQGVRDFNANIENQFAMSKFGYQVGYAGAVAGAGQTDINTQVGMQQQQQYLQTMQQYMGQSQNAGTISSIFSGVSSIFGGAGGMSGITNSLGSIGGKGGGGSTPQVSAFGDAGTTAYSDAAAFSNFEIPDFSYTSF
jgi:hypothetical protein